MKYIMSRIKGLGMAALGVVFAVAIFVMMNMEVLAQAEGTVTADSAKIRSEASTSSNAVSSVKKGDKLTITEETTGSDGMVWYKVFVDADTLGYIRSDLIKKGEGSISQGTSTSTVAVTPITQQSATVTGNNVRVRDNAGTSGSIVTTIQDGTVITLTGEATGSDGKKWYEVSFNSGTNTVTGFIRSDFIQIDESAVVPEETPQTSVDENTTQTEEQPVEEATEEMPNEEIVPEEPAVSQDYEVVYKQDTEGEYHWYLNNYIEGKGYKVAELLDAQEANAEYLAECAKTINNQKMIIAVLAILLAALLIIITLMTFKIRDYAYEEEEERGKYEERAARPQRPAAGQRPASQRAAGEGQRRPAAQKPAGQRPVAEGQRRPAAQKPASQRPMGEGQPRPAAQRPASQRPMGEGQPRPTAQKPVSQRATEEGQRRPAPQKQASQKPAAETPVRRERPAQKVTVTDNGWKSKNFLTEDDDEFEFEFLNLDNDDE